MKLVIVLSLPLQPDPTEIRLTRPVSDRLAETPEEQLARFAFEMGARFPIETTGLIIRRAYVDYSRS